MAEVEPEVMPIRIQCGGCKKVLAVKDHLAGKRVACPVCKTSVQVPGSSGAPLPVRPKGPSAEELENLAAESLGGDAAKPDAAPPTEAPAANGQGATKPPILFSCNYCEAELKVEFEQAGKQMPCPECSRVVKVPLPKEEKPKDWRTVQKAGPSMAASSQPEKLDNAWGTEGTKKVSQAALVEAGVVAKPAARKAPLADRVATWIKRAVVGAIVAAIAVWLIGVKGARNETNEADNFEKVFRKNEWHVKWPPLRQAEFHRAMGRRRLQLPKGGEPGLESWTMARMKALEPGDAKNEAKDKIDRDLFLIRLAVEQVRLGGEDLAIRSKERFDWGNEVFVELKRTLAKIESPEARVIAIRELTAALAEHKKIDLAVGLAGLNDAKTQHVALLLADGKADEAAAILPAPEPNRAGLELPSRIAYAEGLVRQSKPAEAIALADAKGAPLHRFEALAAVASLLALDPQANEAFIRALDAAQSILDKEIPKDQAIPPWVHLQYIRLVAKAKPEETAKALLGRLKEKAFARRAEFEIALAALDKAPPMEVATARIEAVEPEYRPWAWLTLAHAYHRDRKSFAGPPDDDDHQACRFLCEVAKAP